MSTLAEGLTSLDASLAGCAAPEDIPAHLLVHLGGLTRGLARGFAGIDDETLLPVLRLADPPAATEALAGELSRAAEDGRFALCLRRGAPVLHEAADGRLIALQAVAAPRSLAGVVVAEVPAPADQDALAVLALACARAGLAHDNLTLRRSLLDDAARLEQAVAERTRDLAAERDRAEAASRAKSAFLATVSHELRTPLNGILGMADLLHGEDRDAGRRERLAVIRTCAEDLLRQIDAILDLSRIEAGRIELQPADIDLDAVAVAALRTLAPKAEQKGIALAWLPHPALPRHIRADPGRLRQVLINLAGNALKFSERGAVEIRATARREDGRWRLHLAVHDQGPGMAPEVVAKLFTPFEQGDASINRRFGGSGLGLSISRRLCELMGGGIAVESTPGAGSVFTASILAEGAAPRPHGPRRRVTIVAGGLAAHALAAIVMRLDWEACLPAEAEMAIIDAADAGCFTGLPAHLPVIAVTPLAGLPTGAQAPEHLVCVPRPADPEELERKAAELLGSRRGSGSGELASGGRLAGLRVLAVDDQAVNRMVIAGQLRRFGIEATLAAGGAEAVRMALDGTPWDLVLMDCQMPEVDGFTAVERIRAGGGRMPVVAVTAHAMAGDREECLRRGFDGYLPKPIRPDELAAVLAAQAPAPAPESAADPFAALRAEIGQEVLAEVLRAMLAETPAQVAEACRAAASGDLATAAKRAHAVKGNAGNIMLADLAAAAKALEAAARAADAAAAAAAAPPLAAAWRTAEAVIRAALV